MCGFAPGIPTWTFLSEKQFLIVFSLQETLSRSFTSPLLFSYEISLRISSERWPVSTTFLLLLALVSPLGARSLMAGCAFSPLPSITVPGRQVWDGDGHRMRCSRTGMGQGRTEAGRDGAVNRVRKGLCYFERHTLYQGGTK
jgi:hypothetical protein